MATGKTQAPNFEYVFPSIRGIQAGREYYVSMCPLRLIPKIFLFDEEELVPELRAQRVLNKNRVPEMAQYMVSNRTNYVFSALTASIDGKVRFIPSEGKEAKNPMGLLHVPMDSRFIINDGQHRRAAIEAALKEEPKMGDETIAVVFFIDLGLENAQQMFADLNRHAIRPSTSIGVLYDHRDENAKLVKLVVLRSRIFSEMVEMERSTLSPRSRKLFTLSAIYSATTSLISQLEHEDADNFAQLIIEFWEEVAKHIPEWQLVLKSKISAGEVRRDFIHSHGIALQAIGRAGNALLRARRKQWKTSLKKLNTIDWGRNNASLWEGRAIIGGRVSKSSQNLTLTTNVVKQALGLSLSPEEQRAEAAFLRGEK